MQTQQAEILGVYELVSLYCYLLDQDRLEEWVDLFSAESSYKVISRENEALGLPAPMIWCDNKHMIQDRIASYRDVNEYNLHWPRRIVGIPLIEERNPSGSIKVVASYSLFQTDLEGRTRLFSVGRYEFEVLAQSEGFLLGNVLVVADTSLIQTLLAAPI